MRRELPRIFADTEMVYRSLRAKCLQCCWTGLASRMHALVRMTARSASLAAANEPARRLKRIGSIAPQTAMAPSDGSREQLGPFTRQGDRYLRTLLVHAGGYLRVVEKIRMQKLNGARAETALTRECGRGDACCQACAYRVGNPRSRDRVWTTGSPGDRGAVTGIKPDIEDLQLD